MADFTDATARRVFAWLLTQEDVVRPNSPLYLALYRDQALNPEPSTPGYVRQIITFAENPDAPGRFCNTNTVDFTAGSQAFGPVNRLALFDTATGGEPLWVASMGWRNVLAYETLRVAPVTIQILMW